MNILTVFTRSTDCPNTFEVVWANGVQRQGIITAHVPFNVPHKQLAAELGALHHLLVRRAIFGYDRAGVGRGQDGEPGQPIELTVSQGQVKKLARGASKHMDAYFSLVRWLSVRFSGANITVKNKTDWIKPRAEEHREDITVAKALDDVQPMPGIGEVLVSFHLLERFRQRTNWPEPAVAWQELRKLVTCCDSKLVRSDVYEEASRDRHSVDASILHHSQSGWNFVVGPGDGPRELPTLITAYWRERNPKRLSPIRDTETT